MILKDRREILEKKGAWILAEAIQQAAVSKPHVLVAVPGGRSVCGILKNLDREAVDWEKVHFFMVDERFVPEDHEESNFLLVTSCLERAAVKSYVHPVPYRESDAGWGAAQYEKQLEKYGGRFDITLLASGEDGHIAGLFPEHETVRAKAEYFVCTDHAPKPPPERISSSRKLIERSGMALLLFFGKEKADALSAYLDRERTVESCPAKIVDSIPDRFVLTDCCV